MRELHPHSFTPAELDALPQQLSLLAASGRLLVTEREWEILRLRTGLVDGRPRTMAETAEETGLTPERLRQLESTALRRGRVRRRTGTLRDFYK